MEFLQGVGAEIGIAIASPAPWFCQFTTGRGHSRVQDWSARFVMSKTQTVSAPPYKEDQPIVNLLKIR